MKIVNDSIKKNMYIFLKGIYVHFLYFSQHISKPKEFQARRSESLNSSYLSRETPSKSCMTRRESDLKHDEVPELNLTDEEDSATEEVSPLILNKLDDSNSPRSATSDVSTNSNAILTASTVLENEENEGESNKPGSPKTMYKNHANSTKSNMEIHPNDSMA